MAATLPYTFQQTDQTVTIAVTLPKSVNTVASTYINECDINVYISAYYVKINVMPAIVQIDLYEQIDIQKTLRSTYVGIVPNQYIIISLYKQTHAIWPRLIVTGIDATQIQQRRYTSIQSRTEYDREQSTMETEQHIKIQQQIQAQQSRYSHHEQDTIQQLKQEERVVTLKELNLQGWKSNKPNTPTDSTDDNNTLTDNSTKVTPIETQHIALPPRRQQITTTHNSTRPTVTVQANFSTVVAAHHTARNQTIDTAPIILNSSVAAMDRLMLDAELLHQKAQRYMQHSDYNSACNAVTELINQYNKIACSNVTLTQQSTVSEWYQCRAECYYYMSRSSTSTAQSCQYAEAAVRDITHASTLTHNIDVQVVNKYQSHLFARQHSTTTINHSNGAQTGQLLTSLIHDAVQLYQTQRYQEAVTTYSNAINHCCTVTNDMTLQQLLCDRAACYLQLQQYAECIRDCHQSQALQSNNAALLTDERTQQCQLLTQLRLATALAYTGQLQQGNEIYTELLTRWYNLDDAQHPWYTAQDKQDLLSDAGALQLAAVQ